MKKITIKEQCLWRYDGYKEVDLITKDEIDKLEKKVKFVDSLPDSAILYVADSNVPVQKLAKLYKVSNKLNECSHVIIRKKDIEETLNRISYSYISEFHECKNNLWDSDSSSPDIISDKVIEGYPIYNNKYLDEAIKMDEYANKSLFDPINISFGTESEINERSCEKIENMVNSFDENMSRLGSRLLLNYDLRIPIVRDRISSILNKVPNMRNKDIRFFIDNLSHYYPNYSIKTWQYWIDISLRNPDDEVITKRFNVYLKSFLNKDMLDKSFKIVEI